MKTRSVLEVVFVFSLTLLLVVFVGLSPIGEWGRQVLKRSYIEYLVMMAVPLLILIFTRRNFASFGISFQNLRYHLDIALTAFLPVALSNVPNMFIDYRRMSGALIMAGISIILLFVLAYLLKRKPAINENGMMIGVFILAFFSIVPINITASDRISALIFYVFFLGFAEELLFRGYIQSRLNAAWGRPFHFFGVNWGWGIVITAVLFGLMHFLNLGSLIKGDWQLTPWWGFWTFFASFVNGFIREKTGSIVAPTLLHGLPQGIASAFLGL